MSGYTTRRIALFPVGKPSASRLRAAEGFLFVEVLCFVLWLNYLSIQMSIGPKEAKKIWKYRNQWVALAGSCVIAHGKNLKVVRAAAEKKKVKEYVFDFVSPLPSVGYAV